MGRAFAGELAALAQTLSWARAVAIEPLQTFADAAGGRSLVAVGSGGSVTAAHFVALLHRFRHRTFARHATPLELVLSEPGLADAAVLLLSASGKNRDVLSAMTECARRDVPVLGTVCTRVGSPLAADARAYARAHVFEADVPGGGDGFLATNSLLATLVVLARAYGFPVPDRLEGFGDASGVRASFRGRDSVQVLFGGWAAPAATDLESKLNESTLAAMQICDYRNFGHGRHLWLSRRGAETTVVALVTPETSGLAARTLALLPSDVAVVRLTTEVEGSAGTIELVAKVFALVGEVGRERGLDPGRPHVPEFGRKLYHLAPPAPRDAMPLPVRRKLARTPLALDDATPVLTEALAGFMRRLTKARIGGVVVDYDGTLCTREARFLDLRDDVARECQRLVEHGLTLGIATGRGRSVRTSLQRALPAALWPRVMVGYYNGTTLAPLDDEAAPQKDAPLEPPIEEALARLTGDAVLARVADLTPRRHQITVEPREAISTEVLVAHVMAVLGSLEGRALRVLASTHSVDVLIPGAGKSAVVQEVQRRAADGAEVLCIGDRGRWPGNDYALLGHPLSLSVDDVSSAVTTCWNVAPAGTSGPEAALCYLRALEIKGGVATFRAASPWRDE